MVSDGSYQIWAGGKGSLEAGPTNSDGSCLTISAYAGVAWGMLNCSLCTQTAPVRSQSSAALSALYYTSTASLSPGLGIRQELQHHVKEASDLGGRHIMHRLHKSAEGLLGLGRGCKGMGST